MDGVQEGEFPGGEARGGASGAAGTAFRGEQHYAFLFVCVYSVGACDDAGVSVSGVCGLDHGVSAVLSQLADLAVDSGHVRRDSSAFRAFGQRSDPHSGRAVGGRGGAVLFVVSGDREPEQTHPEGFGAYAHALFAGHGNRSVPGDPGLSGRGHAGRGGQCGRLGESHRPGHRAHDDFHADAGRVHPVYRPDQDGRPGRVRAAYSHSDRHDPVRRAHDGENGGRNRHLRRRRRLYDSEAGEERAGALKNSLPMCRRIAMFASHNRLLWP